MEKLLVDTLRVWDSGRQAWIAPDAEWNIHWIGDQSIIYRPFFESFIPEHYHCMTCGMQKYVVDDNGEKKCTSCGEVSMILCTPRICGSS